MTAVGGLLSNEVGRFLSLKQQVVWQAGGRLLHRVCSGRWSPVRPARTAACEWDYARGAFRADMDGVE